MISEVAVRTVRLFVERINHHDVDGMVDLMSHDHVFVDALGRTFTGRKTMREAWLTYLEWFPDYRIEYTDVVHTGNVVALFGMARGTFAVDGSLPPENAWEIPAAWKAVVRNGQVTDWRVYCDNGAVVKIMEDHRSGRE